MSAASFAAPRAPRYGDRSFRHRSTRRVIRSKTEQKAQVAAADRSPLIRKKADASKPMVARHSHPVVCILIDFPSLSISLIEKR